VAEPPVRVERWDPAAGSPSEAAVGARLAAWGYRAARYVYPPGTYFPPHTHAVDKCDAVVSGRFKLVMGGAEVVLEAGDSLFIPRGTEHSAEVLGAVPVVSLDGLADQPF
jgi:mannose-6-phosphate isomerase-like protein (cupin superfamily)